MSQLPGTREITEGNIVLDCCLLESNRGGVLHRVFLQEFSIQYTYQRTPHFERKQANSSFSTLMPLAVIQKKLTKIKGLIFCDQHHMMTWCLSAESHLTFKEFYKQCLKNVSGCSVTEKAKFIKGLYKQFGHRKQVSICLVVEAIRIWICLGFRNLGWLCNSGNVKWIAASFSLCLVL